MMHARLWMLAVPTLVAGALTAGCDHADPARKATEDARDIAMAERMSREPFKPIIPKPITAIDMTRYGLDKPGCRFRKPGENDPLFIAARDEGFLRIGNDLRRYAAKRESGSLPGDARATYVGLSSWVDLMRMPDNGTGGDQHRWPARLIIHDAQERVAFMADGMVTCSG